MQVLQLFVIAVSTLCVQYCSGAATKRSAVPGDDTIYFSKPEMPSQPSKPAPSHGISMKGDESVPPECRGKTYCNVKPADYPEKELNEMFSSVKKPVFAYQPSLVPQIDLTNRQGDIDERNDCQSMVSFEPLFKVQQKDTHNWRVVVQAPGAAIVQKVRLETCLNEKSSCFKAVPGSSEFTTMCKQLYNTWEVLVKVEGKNETELIRADLPVCCSCHYKLNFDNRFGKPIGGKS